MIVSVQPIGFVAEGVLADIAHCITGALGLEVRVKDAESEPMYAWDARRGQYNSFDIMKTLALAPLDGAVRVLGVTECDLFIPALTFVFGQAQLNGPTAVVSFARLHQSFYGLPEDAALFRLRLRKEVMHEMGHTLGLIHCSETLCTMRLSTGIIQVDVKEDRFCGSCEHEVREKVARWRRGES